MHIEELEIRSDEHLLALIQDGDRKAFNEVYERYWKKLLNYAGRVIRDQDEAKDIVQEIFVSLWKQKDKATAIKSLSSYLHGAVRFKGIAYIRANYHKNNYIANICQYLNEDVDLISEELDAKELDAIIQLEIQKLPPKMREVFVLSRLEQLSYREIALKLNISEETVKKQIHRALKHFKLVLDERSGGLLAIVITGFFLD